METEESATQAVEFTEDDIIQLAIESRRTVANGIVKNHIIASVTLGLVPIPLFDLAALTTTQINMLRSLSEHYEVPPADTDVTSLVTSLIAGSLPVLGVIGLSSFAKLIPGIGSLAGSASLSISAGAVTYAVGQTFIMHFEEGGTLEDFKPKQAQKFFQRQFEVGKSFVKDIRNELNEMKNGADETASDDLPAAKEQVASDKATS